MTEKKIPVILDGDPGHDDAIAWVVAASDPRFDIRAITTVAGNQTLAKVTYNARRIATLLKLDCEVAAGREVPMCADLIIAPNYHGESGLDGPRLPEPKMPESELSAVELMAKVLRESEEKVVIIATGPQTNVGALLVSHPELKEKIALISTMGGGLRNGNWTTSAEFNILVDPESAYIEYHSGAPLQMCGLDVTEKAQIFPEEWEKIRAIGNPVARTVAEWLDFFFIHLKELGWEGATLHDPCAVLSLIYPEVFDIRDYYVDIDLCGRYTRGATVPDYTGVSGQKPNCKAVMGLDRERFVEILAECCRKFDGWEEF
ncbi:MAG: nucleoside hydrolase [Erysipelotrichaceae bacterium]|nr:nucleoside hydrolase [Erysipelotrichaceae bacterium]